MTETVTQTETHIGIEIPSLWAVKFHNDDYTPMDFVTAVIMRYFRVSIEEAATIMLTIHQKGSAIVGESTKDIAQTKVAHITSQAQAAKHPLYVEAVAI